MGRAFPVVVHSAGGDAVLHQSLPPIGVPLIAPPHFIASPPSSAPPLIAPCVPETELAVVSAADDAVVVVRGEADVTRRHAVRAGGLGGPTGARRETGTGWGRGQERRSLMRSQRHGGRRQQRELFAEERRVVAALPSPCTHGNGPQTLCPPIALNPHVAGWPRDCTPPALNPALPPLHPTQGHAAQVPQLQVLASRRDGHARVARVQGPAPQLKKLPGSCEPGALRVRAFVGYSNEDICLWG